MIPGQHIKKVVNYKSASPQVVPRSILKRPATSTAKLTSTTEYASETICAQKAIKFSQRKMQDIECYTKTHEKVSNNERHCRGYRLLSRLSNTTLKIYCSSDEINYWKCSSS